MRLSKDRTEKQYIDIQHRKLCSSSERKMHQLGVLALESATLTDIDLHGSVKILDVTVSDFCFCLYPHSPICSSNRTNGHEISIPIHFVSSFITCSTSRFYIIQSDSEKPLSFWYLAVLIECCIKCIQYPNNLQL